MAPSQSRRRRRRRGQAPAGWKPADPPRRPALFVNPRSGRGAGPRIAAQARDRGIAVAEFGPDRSLTTQVDEAVGGGADALAVAGGDGSLATVARPPRSCTTSPSFASRREPATTSPATWGSIRPIQPRPSTPSAMGSRARIDVGEVNGSIFLNNVSLGIYAEAIHHAGYRDAKVRTLVETARTVLGPGAEISGAESRRRLGVGHVDPAIVLVSNNPYALGGPLVARRTSDARRRPPRDHRHRPTGARRRPSSRAWSSASLWVDAPDPVHAGIDGEAVELSPPLEFAVRPAALRVRTPRRSRAARGSARVSG